MQQQVSNALEQPDRPSPSGKGIAITGPEFRIDDSMRGVPGGTDSMEAAAVADAGWSVSAGDLAYPVLTVCASAYAANRAAILDYAAGHDALLAPHIKTPMSPDIAHDLIGAGAWGVSVASLQQASVMLRSGVTRFLFANQLGGERTGEAFGRLLAAYPEAAPVLFVDSLESLKAVDRAGRVAGRALPVLVEVGLARAGLRDAGRAQRVIDAALDLEHVALAGVAAYEGAVASADPIATSEAIARLNRLAADVFKRVRAAVPDAHLFLSSGGSQYFDLVVEALAPLVRADGKADLVVRSGAIFFNDHGVYARALERMDERRGFDLNGAATSAARTFRPAMRLWGEVLSRPEPELAICGVGMRDASFDRGFPVPLNAWRGGACVTSLADAAEIDKLNDQHGFLHLTGAVDLKVGDIVEFGISHPCTCFDRWGHFFLIDERHEVLSVHRTFFG